MKLKDIGIGCIVTLSVMGCEHVIDFQENNDTVQEIAINALAVPDTIFTAAISRTYLFTDIPALDYPDYWEYAIRPDSFYYTKAVLPQANVALTVNGADTYTMQFDPVHFNFTSDYKPRSGDHLRVSVKAEGLPSAFTETQIPKAERLEILDTKKYYDKRRPTHSAMSDMAQDTVMRITLRLTDPVNTPNYYRLKVRSIAKSINSDGISSLQFSDVYTSSDVIFMNEELSLSYGGWPVHFSNIFDDHLFNGKQYTFSVETRMRYGEKPQVVIELQSMTSDFYYYLKSIMLYRITVQDSYTESVQIHSNVNGGWGIVGGINSEKQTILFR